MDQSNKIQLLNKFNWKFHRGDEKTRLKIFYNFSKFGFVLSIIASRTIWNDIRYISITHDMLLMSKNPEKSGPVQNFENKWLFWKPRGAENAFFNEKIVKKIYFKLKLLPKDDFQTQVKYIYSGCPHYNLIESIVGSFQ